MQGEHAAAADESGVAVVAHVDRWAGLLADVVGSDD